MYQLNLSIRRGASIVFVLLFVAVASAAAQTSAFTYQGRFSDASVAQPTNGTYNMQFALFGSIGGADNQIGFLQSHLVGFELMIDDRRRFLQNA